ncbi:MAG: YtxH domain-containing protein [Cyclobacteriaceae bacterium]|nr:YtxH domain-containing protein [Cyclobacteriaceae bacterium]
MSRNSGSSFFSFLLGVMAGGILGLLFAPEKGSNTRDKLSFLLDKYRNQLEEIMKEMMEGKKAIQNDAKSEGERRIKDAKTKAEELLDDVNGLINQIRKN